MVSVPIDEQLSLLHRSHPPQSRRLRLRFCPHLTARTITIAIAVTIMALVSFELCTELEKSSLSEVVDVIGKDGDASLRRVAPQDWQEERGHGHRAPEPQREYCQVEACRLLLRASIIRCRRS